MEINKLNVISAETLFELDYNSDQVINDRRERGLSIDFFFYVRKSGYVVNMRDLHDVVDSIDICLEGGLNELGEIADTATEQQKQSVDRIVNELKAFFPTSGVFGFYDFNRDYEINKFSEYCHGVMLFGLKTFSLINS